MDYIKNKRIIALVGLACLLLGVFLAYYKVSLFGFSQSVSLIQAWQGIIILILTIVIAFFIFKDYVKKVVPKLFKSSFGKKIESLNDKLVLVPIVLIIIILFTAGGDFGSVKSLVSHGAGFYFSWLGVLLTIAHVFTYKNDALDKLFKNKK